MKVKSLHDLYVAELKDLYNAENQILRALPKMAKAAAAEDLQQAFEDHLAQTRAHVERLEEIFNRIGIPARGRKCKGMEGLIEEGNDLMSDAADESVQDAALIAAAQRVEHYEIAGYGTARTFARMLGDEEAAQLLQQTLDEEGQTDRHLTELADSHINAEAAAIAE